MCKDGARRQPDSSDKTPCDGETPSNDLVMRVGSLEDITENVSIWHAENDSFDLTSFLERADSAVPGAAAIADAINQYGYALVRFPEGKSFRDLMPRRTPGYEGYSHFATYAKDGGIGGGNAAIKQAGLQPPAVANLAMQGAAFALGLAYMARIDNKLVGIRKGIDSILAYMETDYLSRLKGHATTLIEYGDSYEECVSDISERTSIITDTRRICSDLNGCWQKELLNIQNLRRELGSVGKSIKEAEARDYLRKYGEIVGRMDLIFTLMIVARQVLLRYRNSFSIRQIEKERSVIAKMLREYHDARDEAMNSFALIAPKIKIPLGKTLPDALVKSLDGAKRSAGVALGLWAIIPIVSEIKVIAGAATAAVAISNEVNKNNVNQQHAFQRDVTSTVGDSIDEASAAHMRELDRIEFKFNKANAILMGHDGAHALVVIDKPRRALDR